MLSYGRNGAWQRGQCDAGHASDWRKGSRWMQTFRKLPTVRPNRPTKNAAVVAPIYLGAAEGRASSFRQLTELASAVPMWDLHRPMQFEDTGSVVDLIASTTAR